MDKVEPIDRATLDVVSMVRRIRPVIGIRTIVPWRRTRPGSPPPEVSDQAALSSSTPVSSPAISRSSVSAKAAIASA